MRQEGEVHLTSRRISGHNPMACPHWTVAAMLWLGKGRVEAASFLTEQFSLSDTVQEKPTAPTSNGLPVKESAKGYPGRFFCGPNAKEDPAQRQGRSTKPGRELATHRPLFSIDSFLPLCHTSCLRSKSLGCLLSLDCQWIPI